MRTVGATVKLLSALQGSGMAVLEDFHPAHPGSLTIVDPETDSAVTIAIVEVADDTDQPCLPAHRDAAGVCREAGCWALGQAGPKAS